MTYSTPALGFVCFSQLVSFLTVRVIHLMDVFTSLFTIWPATIHLCVSQFLLRVILGSYYFFHPKLIIITYSEKSCNQSRLLFTLELFTDLKNFILYQDGRRPFELVYHGQFDDSRPRNNVPVTGRLATLSFQFPPKILLYCELLMWLLWHIL